MNKTIENQDYTYIIYLIIMLLLIILFYTNSKSYLVKKTIKKLDIIENYQNIESYDEDEEKELKDLQICSAYNCLSRYRCRLDYQDVDILRHLLRLGVRYIELNIFADSFEYGSRPIVSCGFKEGQWKSMLNNIPFEDCVKVLKENIFTQLSNISGSPNYEDPFFLGLNLHTGYNTETLNKVGNILIEEFADYLLPPQYSYQYEEHFENIKYNVLKGKLVLFSSPGFEGSKLEELINASWIDDTTLNNKETFMNYFTSSSPAVNALELQHYGEEGFIVNDEEDNEETDLYDELIDEVIKSRKILRISASTINSYGFDTEYLRKHNKSGMTIVVPNIEGDIMPVNWNPNVAWDLGCQFVAMNFQELDENIDKYVSHFRKSGITLK